MEIKKSPKANLDDKRLTFTLIGLVVALFVIWRVFEYRSYDKQQFEAFARTVEVMDEEMEITKQEQPKPQIQAPKPQVTQIQVVDDEAEVEDIDINAEVDQDEVIEEYVYEAPEIEEEEIVEEEAQMINIQLGESVVGNLFGDRPVSADLCKVPYPF